MKTITLITALQRLVQCLLVGSLLALAGTSLATERVTYYHNDALGSPVAATDANGTLLWREEYAPYGERLKKEASSKDTLWYTGKQEESTFGLSYFGARWYDPKVGRFMGVDSAGYSEDSIHSYSKYAYANNNPYLYVDPDGNFPFLVPLAIFIAKEVAAEGFSQLTGFPNLSVKGLVKSGAKGVGKLLGRSKVRKDVTKGPLARGRAAEQRVLDDLGLSKNTHKVRTGEGASIPDALTKRQSIEIKDCIGVSCTKQIRIQTEAARNSGRQSTLITGDKTHVSGPAQRAFDNIIRRPDLGPQ